MGGRVWIESEVGSGSRFHFVAHFGVQHGDAATRRAPASADDLRGSARPGRRRQRDQSPHPRRDAHELADEARVGRRRARRRSPRCARRPSAATPFRLVLTDAHDARMSTASRSARAIRDDRAACGRHADHADLGGPAAPGTARRDAGFAAYLSKPVKQSDLLDAILTVFAPPRAARTTAPPARRSASRRRGGVRCASWWPKTIATNQKLVVTLLEQRGDTVVVAPNGREAVQTAAEQRVRRHPDGRADAGDERPRGDRRDPRARAVDRRAHPDRGHDGARDDRRSRAVPRGRDGRLRLEAAAAGRAPRGH